MLKFFFHRHCLMVRLMEVAGVAGLAAIVWRTLAGDLSPLQLFLFTLILIQYLFLRFCTIWRWYPNVSRELGIGLQFKKAIVPTGYILTVFNWLFVLSQSTVLLFIAAMLLAVISHVNVILLYLHFKDKDEMPVNAFTMTH